MHVNDVPDPLVPVFALVWHRKVSSLGHPKSPPCPTFDFLVFYLSGVSGPELGAPRGAWGPPDAAATSFQRKTVSKYQKERLCEKIVSLYAVAFP